MTKDFAQDYPEAHALLAELARYYSTVPGGSAFRHQSIAYLAASEPKPEPKRPCNCGGPDCKPEPKRDEIEALLESATTSWVPGPGDCRADSRWTRVVNEVESALRLYRAKMARIEKVLDAMEVCEGLAIVSAASKLRAALRGDE